MNPVVHLHHPIALDILVVGLGRPGDWSGIATQFFAMAISALVIRAALARPKGRAPQLGVRKTC